jgi:hypothetical protein
MMMKNPKKGELGRAIAQRLAVVSIDTLAAGTLAFANDDGPPHLSLTINQTSISSGLLPC